MHVKELADLAETTVRTVRYYHHVGLLPAPPARVGVREYDLYHLARLLRIRWLAESGLPLAAIGEVLSEPGTPAPDNAAEELRQALLSMDARIAQLRGQRQELVGLLESAEMGRRLTPLSARVAGLYDRVAALVSSDAARRAVEAERSMMVFLAVHGVLPPTLDDLVADLDAEDDADTVDLFNGFAALADASGPEADDILQRLLATSQLLIDRHADAIARLAVDLPRGLAGVALWATVRRLARVGFPVAAQQRFLDLVIDSLLADPRIAGVGEATRR
ncbi:MerR family transcriptional regulator [Raineyella sp. W15-4]|uniref:helix-turn-helix domain-containing protein n=1 Tax=Raineyella sp. W15-4 TaxID=3081651 RepID=UPI002952BF92|nr:MerR family transcriptional regulator [Raineyella sp. W15-4]WOQ16155.1 MerR family transcriptional regulator [Raineyella sp. W15-4]